MLGSIPVFVSAAPGGGLVASDGEGGYLTHAETLSELRREVAKKLLGIHGYPRPFTLFVGPPPARQGPHGAPTPAIERINRQSA